MAIAVFACQVVYVFLLGFQSRNVRDGQYHWQWRLARHWVCLDC